MAIQFDLAETINKLRKEPEEIDEVKVSANRLIRFFELLIEIDSI
jgi:hypothetical protein